MPKNIVVCFDGTWNGKDLDTDDDGAPENTNVLKLFRSLTGETTPESKGLKDEEERVSRDGRGEVDQVAKYLHGVGDSRSAIKKMLGGALGAGLVRRIVRGYTFVCRNYEPGDRIFIVGFSRGAYTARALGGMIAKAGLMDYAALGNPDKEQAYRHGIYVWAYYREGVAKRKKGIRGLYNLWKDVIEGGREVGEEQMIADVPVEAIGVWDTVGALGIPVYDKGDARIDLFKFADLDLSPRVKHGFHAVAIDEYRKDFTPSAWNPRDGITQVWFVGAHADVGGGYPETGLSDIALAWMMNALDRLGLRFATPPPVGDAFADVHDSHDAPLYRMHPKVDRRLWDGCWVHRTYDERFKKLEAYRPGALRDWMGEFVD